MDYRTQKILLTEKISDELRDYFIWLCHQSNNLYNFALYQIRQAHFKTCPQYEYFDQNQMYRTAYKDGNFSNLVCLKCSQIESPLGEKIVQQCRGIILDESDNWQIVSYPYDKFFNYGECHAQKLNWETAQIYAKLDGSLITLYLYQGKWRVQSSGMADGAGEVSSRSNPPNI